MKTTKNMVYKPTTETRELHLYATNNFEVYTRFYLPIIKNLNKKHEKGIYETEKAMASFYRIATEASKAYKKEFGFAFTVTERYTVAIELEAEYIEEMEG